MTLEFWEEDWCLTYKYNAKHTFQVTLHISIAHHPSDMLTTHTPSDKLTLQYKNDRQAYM